MKPTITRREFVMGSTALLALAGMSRSGIGQTPGAINVPIVDTLVVRVITDSSYDTPRTMSHKMVKVRRAPTNSRVDFRKAIHSEWGLALALESRIGVGTRHLMLDYGYTPEALMNNMEIIGIDPTKTQALILSHGHFDHFGGLIDFLKKYRAQLPAELTLYAGGEDNFCQRTQTAGTPGHFTEWGVLDRKELAKLNVKVVKCEQPTVIEGHAFTTGNIPRRSFEKVFPGGQVSYRKGADGVGCDMPELDAKAQGKNVHDEHWSEHATCFNLKDRGLVVISSCGHSGIVNSVRRAIEVSGVSKVHAVLGGFHLFPADEDYLRRVVAEMKAMNVDVVIPLHCSGPGMVTAMREMLADRLLTSTTGTEFTFGA